MSCRRLRKSTIYKIGILAGIFFLCAILLLTLYLFLIPQKFEEYVEENAERYGVETALIYAVIRAESNFQVQAVSSAGAVGLMQLMPETALFIENKTGQGGELTEPADNIRMGTWYLAYLTVRFGKTDEAIAAYNAGEGRVRQWLNNPAYTDESNRLLYIPYKETQDYVRKVKFFYNCYKIFYS